MPLKTVLGDLEWKISLIVQSRWATFKITLTVIFVRKTYKLSWTLLKLNYDVIFAFANIIKNQFLVFTWPSWWRHHCSSFVKGHRRFKFQIKLNLNAGKLYRFFSLVWAHQLKWCWKSTVPDYRLKFVLI